MRHPRKEIATQDLVGNPNGKVVLIWEEGEPILPPGTLIKHIYLTTVQKGRIKGPHLHNKKWSQFCCVRGNVRIVVQRGKSFREYYTGEDYEYALIQVPPGTPAALQNIGTSEALVLNLPTERFDPEDNVQVQFKGYTWRK